VDALHPRFGRVGLCKWENHAAFFLLFGLVSRNLSAIRSRLLASTAAPTNSSKRSRPWALSGAPDKAHYLESGVIQSNSSKPFKTAIQSCVAGSSTPDNCTEEEMSPQS
jgi:hypothetical protein